MRVVASALYFRRSVESRRDRTGARTEHRRRELDVRLRFVLDAAGEKEVRP